MSDELRLPFGSGQRRGVSSFGMVALQEYSATNLFTLSDFPQLIRLKVDEQKRTLVSSALKPMGYASAL